jgi:hypothetical protein
VDNEKFKKVAEKWRIFFKSPKKDKKIKKSFLEKTQYFKEFKGN